MTWTASSGAEAQRPDAKPDQFLYTRVTFTLTPEPGGTRLAVAESGFTTAAMDERARGRAYADNAEGWEIELDTAAGAWDDRLADVKDAAEHE